MSADNGIYIGRFPKTPGSTEYEYRTIHAQAIDNVFFQEPEGNPYFVVEYFKEAEPTSEAEALNRAFAMEREILEDEMCPILEYGISNLRFPHPWEWYNSKHDEYKNYYDPQIEGEG